MENPIKINDLGGNTAIFGSTQYHISYIPVFFAHHLLPNLSPAHHTCGLGNGCALSLGPLGLCKQVGGSRRKWNDQKLGVFFGSKR